MFEVIVIMNDADGIDYTYWGDETGTLEFYMVWNTLKAYLGDNFKVYTHPTNDTFIVENDDDDEGCDYSYDIIKFIESFMPMLILFKVKCIYIL